MSESKMETVGDIIDKYAGDSLVTVQERYIDAVRLRNVGLTFREIGEIIGPCGAQRAAEIYRKGLRLLSKSGSQGTRL